MSQGKCHSFFLFLMFFFFFSPPTIPRNPLVAPFKNSLEMPSVLCVHIHLFSSEWERRLWPSKYFNSVSMCLCVPFLRWSLEFLIRVCPFLSLFCVNIMTYLLFVKCLIKCITMVTKKTHLLIVRKLQTAFLFNIFKKEYFKIKTIEKNYYEIN